MTECGWKRAWQSPCPDSAGEGGRCDKHRGKLCSSCGAPATGDCDDTMGPFVCGAPLCDDCEHTLCANGCNSAAPRPKGMGAHCKKGEQKFKIWAAEGAREYNARIAAEHGIEEDVFDGKRWLQADGEWRRG